MRKDVFANVETWQTHAVGSDCRTDRIVMTDCRELWRRKHCCLWHTALWCNVYCKCRALWAQNCRCHICRNADRLIKAYSLSALKLCQILCVKNWVTFSGAEKNRLWSCDFSCQPINFDAAAVLTFMLQQTQHSSRGSCHRGLSVMYCAELCII